MGAARERVFLGAEQSAGAKRSDRFHKALAAEETITGLITAMALVYPDKKLASVKPSSIVKRMKEKQFAAKVDRDIIRECEQIGISLPEFSELCLKAMQGISAEMGLCAAWIKFFRMDATMPGLWGRNLSGS